MALQYLYSSSYCITGERQSLQGLGVNGFCPLKCTAFKTYASEKSSMLRNVIFVLVLFPVSKKYSWCRRVCLCCAVCYSVNDGWECRRFECYPRCMILRMVVWTERFNEWVHEEYGLIDFLNASYKIFVL